ncbi:hypothetical protein [Rhizobium tubonense]|uniref:Uncharacterized protein n=1 Tax=Rhizobium tubonense TaxID=484088 RepID=A0A2W4CCJ4_9HYPH|nr:hypothetical protein [Rhizobium tubonense]PZM08595.1 hypothetical protein CPY51_28355 [Rhizobium tubonense]
MSIFDLDVSQVLCTPGTSRSGWQIRLVIGRQAAFWLDWAMVRSLPHTALPDISIVRAQSGSSDLYWEGVLVDVVLKRSV